MRPRKVSPAVLLLAAVEARRGYSRLMTGVISTLVLVMVTSASGQSDLTKRDAQGPVTVTATLLSKPTAGLPVRVKVAPDTHSVALDTIALDKSVMMRTPNGAEVAPSEVEEAKGGSHHREAILVYPPIDKQSVRIVVRDVGGVSERELVWELPQ